MAVIVQRIEKQYTNDINKAIKYYTVLFDLNNIHLSSMQLALLSFVAVKQRLNDYEKLFIDIFDSSAASLENTKCKLMKMGWLIKQENKCVVNPAIALDFTSDLIIQMKLNTIQEITPNNIPYDRVNTNRVNTVREVEEGVVQESE